MVRRGWRFRERLPRHRRTHPARAAVRPMGRTGHRRRGSGPARDLAGTHAPTPFERAAPSRPAPLPVMPLVWRTAARPEPDVVISSSHAFAHTVKLGAPQRTRHLSYV